jgi:hypothetical protein
MHEAATAPATIERLAYNPLDRRELYGVLAYVTHQTGGDILHGVDSRYPVQVQLQHLQAIQSGASIGQAAVAQLVQMLSQLGFNIDVPTPSTASGLIQREQATLKTIPPGQTGDMAAGGTYGAAAEPQKIELHGVTYAVTVTPANAKPDLNFIGRAPLLRYLGYLGMDDQQAATLAQLILHWRGDRDQVEISGIAETWYAGRDMAYAAPGRPIDDWGQLYFLMESSPDLVAFLRRNFTIRGSTQVDIHYLTPAMLAALAGVQSDDAKKALKHLLDPEERERGLPLNQVVGFDVAAKIEAVATGSPLPDMALRVTIKGPALALSAVYDPKQHAVVDASD